MTLPEQAELSAISTSVVDLTDRVTAIAERLNGRADGAEAAAFLFETERSLRTAARSLDRALRSLR